MLVQGGVTALAQTLCALQPISFVALLATLVLLFGSRVSKSSHRRFSSRCWRLIQVYANAGIAYALNRAFGTAQCCVSFGVIGFSVRCGSQERAARC
jgi:arsenite transporter